jgi:hypothetical protein
MLSRGYVARNGLKNLISTTYLTWLSYGLVLWGAISDERTGLSFVYVAGPYQRSLSWARVP